jgi:hypothetical protein
MKTLNILVVAFFFIFIIKINAQEFKDYIITTGNDTIKNISITAFPETAVIVGNPYEKKVHKYSDMRILYKVSNDQTKKNDLRYEFCNIKEFFVNNQKHTTWHTRTLPVKDDKIVFDEIIDVPNMKANQLYAYTKSFIIQYYKFSNDTFDKYVVQDTLMKSLTIRGMQIKTSSPTFTFNDWVLYDVDFKTKDNKCRITIKNIHIHYETGVFLNHNIRAEFNETFEKAYQNMKDEDGDFYFHRYVAVNHLVYNIQDRLLPQYKEFIQKSGKQDEEW